jgi:peptide/nickel transport system permease protein
MVEIASTTSTVKQKAADNLVIRLWGRAREIRLPLFPCIFLLAFLLAGIGGEWVAPHDPNAMDLPSSFQPPAWQEGGSWSYPLGRDNLGRDILSRMISGASITLAVALLAIVVSATLGVFIGLLSGFLGGATDVVIMRTVDIFMAIPSLALALVFAAVLPPGLTTIVFVIAITYWSWYARIIRGEILSLRERDFVALAKVAGCGAGTILLRHLLPNVLNSVLVLTTLQVGQVIMFESALSFLGLGITMPLVSWGGMLSDARGYMTHAWWMVAFPGIAILLTCLSANLLGDWMRDRFDPRMREL